MLRFAVRRVCVSLPRGFFSTPKLHLRDIISHNAEFYFSAATPKPVRRPIGRPACCDFAGLPFYPAQLAIHSLRTVSRQIR